MNRFAPRLRAFTLVETIVVVALFAVMLIALFDFYINYNATYLHEEAVVKTASSAGAVVAEVAELASAAGQVLPSHAFGGTTYVSGAGTLVLEIPSVDDSGAVVAGSYDYAAFYRDGAKVYRVLDADADSVRRSGTRLLSDSVASLTFSYDAEGFPDVGRVTVDIVTELQVKGTTVDQHLTQQVTLRNDAVL